MTEQNHPRGYIPPEHLESEKKQRRQMFIILAIVVVLVGIAIACGLSFANMGENLSTEMENIETTLNGFMVAMADKDIETANSFLTNTAAKKLSGQLSEMVNSEDNVLFDGYDSMKSTGFKIKTITGKVPASTATATYELAYTDGSSGQLTVLCEKWNDEWMIASFRIDKFAGSFTSP